MPDSKKPAPVLKKPKVEAQEEKPVEKIKDKSKVNEDDMVTGLTFHIASLL